MSQLFDLLLLPAKVFCEAMRFVGMDPYCQNLHRTIWLELLRSKQFTLQCPVNMSEIDELSWLLRRNIKCSRVSFSFENDSYQPLSDYLRRMGRSVRTVNFFDNATLFQMMLVAMHCRHLTSLRVCNLTVSCAIREVMLNNPDLQEICCAEVKCSEKDIFNGLSLHKLKMLRIDNTHCLEGFPWHETAFSDSLLTVIWDISSILRKDLRALFANCPRIQSFSANYVHLDQSFIGALGGNVVNLSLCGNDVLTDASVLYILQHLSSLRTLNIQDCSLLTETTLRHLAEYVGGRLKVLYVDIKHPESAEIEAVLEIFSQKCTKLKYVNVNCGNKVLCSGTGTSLIVGGCPQLQMLVANKYTTISASSRGFTAMIRPDLKILVHSEDTLFGVMSMPME